MRPVLRTGSVAVLFAMTAFFVAAADGCQLIVGSGDYAIGASISSADGSTEGGDDVTMPMTDDGGGTPVDAPHGDSGAHIGDPCKTSLNCPHGSTCQGLYCTEPCPTSAACGANSAGQPNLCLTNATSGGKSCVPSCLVPDDCTAYPGTTCTAVSGAKTSYCAGGMEAGPTSGAIGDPCAVDTDCTAPANCSTKAWCTVPCASASDTSCGANSLGEPNHCVSSNNGLANPFICFPGCTTNASCLSFAGTDCQPVQSGSTTVSICAGSQGAIGDPCTDPASTSAWGACGADVDSGPVPSCNGSWCALLDCTTDTSCGTNTVGQGNYCVPSGANGTDGGARSLCFPGCTQYADCATYAGTFCQPIVSSTRGFVCANSGGDIGDPCSTDADCTAGTCSIGWCTQACAGPSDGASCGTGGTNLQGNANHCVFDTFASAYQCYPGCTVQSDCIPYAGATCQSVAGQSGQVCKF